MSLKELFQSHLETLFAVRDWVIVVDDINSGHILYNNPTNTANVGLCWLESTLAFDVIAP